jgi:hypothetical protein
VIARCWRSRPKHPGVELGAHRGCEPLVARARRRGRFLGGLKKSWPREQVANVRRDLGQ